MHVLAGERIRHPNKMGDLTGFTLAVLNCAAWAGVALYLTTGHGQMEGISSANYAIGRDFVIFWTAAQLAASDQALGVFDPAKFMAAAHRLFNPALPFHFWSYPPTALFVVAPLAHLPYLAAYALWNVVGLALLFAAAFAFLPRGDLWWVITSPAVAVNVVMGQNGFLTAALFFAGFATLQRRPALSGVWFGLLTFKPQLGLLVPVAAVAARSWRLIAAAAATAVLLIGLSIVVYGPFVWQGFFGPTAAQQARMTLIGTGSFFVMSPSPLMAAHALGLGPLAEGAVQAPFALYGIWLAWRVWRRPGDAYLAAAITLLATFIATPQSFNYDLIPLGAASLALARTGSRLDQILACMMWSAPLSVMLVNGFHVPVMPLVLTAAAVRLNSIASKVAGTPSAVGATATAGGAF